MSSYKGANFKGGQSNNKDPMGGTLSKMDLTKKLDGGQEE